MEKKIIAKKNISDFIDSFSDKVYKLMPNPNYKDDDIYDKKFKKSRIILSNIKCNLLTYINNTKDILLCSEICKNFQDDLIILVSDINLCHKKMKSLENLSSFKSVKNFIYKNIDDVKEQFKDNIRLDEIFSDATSDIILNFIKAHNINNILNDIKFIKFNADAKGFNKFTKLTIKFLNNIYNNNCDYDKNYDSINFNPIVTIMSLKRSLLDVSKSLGLSSTIPQIVDGVIKGFNKSIVSIYRPSNIKKIIKERGNENFKKVVAKSILLDTIMNSTEASETIKSIGKDKVVSSIKKDYNDLVKNKKLKKIDEIEQLLDMLEKMKK